MRQAQSPAELGFDQHDRRRLAQALAQAKAVRTYRRLHAVLLVAQGRSTSEVADLIRADLATIYRWIARYLRRHQVVDLADRPRTGRAPAASQITPARIERELARDPLKLGYSTTSWTVPLLATHLSQRFNCPITPVTLRRRMKQCQLCWKRPRYVYAEKAEHIGQKKGPLFGA
jgi:transposase